MGKLSWTVGIKPFVGPIVDYTTYVLSISYMNGRTSYLDQFTGGTLLVTLNNQSNIAANFPFGAVLALNSDLYFEVTGVEFNDYPGNTGMSTCTVTAVDYLQASGRTYGGAITTPQLTLQQLDVLYSGVGSNTDIVRNGGTSVAAYANYVGLFLQRFQQGMNLEASGAVQLSQNKVYVSGREQDNGIYFRTTFTRNTSTGSNVSYASIRRDRADLKFANQITVQSNSNPTVTVTNTDSVNLYGVYNDSVSVVDANTTAETTGLGQWLSNSRSDPALETYEIEVLDTSQSAGALGQIQSIWGETTARAKVHDLVYRVPGTGSDTTVTVFLEGTRIAVTPQQTRLTYYFSPMTLYQFFLLDNATQGILDTSRLGW